MLRVNVSPPFGPHSPGRSGQDPAGRAQTEVSLAGLGRARIIPIPHDLPIPLNAAEQQAMGGASVDPGVRRLACNPACWDREVPGLKTESFVVSAEWYFEHIHSVKTTSDLLRILRNGPFTNVTAKLADVK